MGKAVTKRVAKPYSEMSAAELVQLQAGSAQRLDPLVAALFEKLRELMRLARADDV